ncbi:MAG: ATP synthase F1 subunit delta [Oscillospiraceae bacterium]|nr:ATP synthase F1 subunit delta [Oscillospiraceae bacterium]
MGRLNVIYATALFNIALEQDVVDDFLSQSIFLCDSLSDKEFRRILIHPQIAADEKREIFNKAFSGKIHKDLLAFLYLVVDKNREIFLISALKTLISFIKRHKKIVVARVQSAVPYDEKQAKSLKATLSSKLDKHVELDIKVDKSLIGGPYIFVDGYYIDWTVKTRLHDLTVNMKERY